MSIMNKRLIPVLTVVFVMGFLVFSFALKLLTESEEDKAPKGDAFDLVGTYETLITYPIDGDTVILSNGNRVRVVGIDAPEVGEPFSRVAKRKMKELTKDQTRLVLVEECPEERKDKYSRVLAWISIDGVDLGAVLLKEGLAKTLTIPPCGLHRKAEYAEYQKEAKAKKLGIWSGRDEN